MVKLIATKDSTPTADPHSIPRLRGGNRPLSAYVSDSGRFVPRDGVDPARVQQGFSRALAHQRAAQKKSPSRRRAEIIKKLESALTFATEQAGA